MQVKICLKQLLAREETKPDCSYFPSRKLSHSFTRWSAHKSCRAGTCGGPHTEQRAAGRVAGERRGSGVAGRCWAFLHAHKGADNQRGTFYITELYVQKPISNKTFNVKTMVHLNNWTWFVFAFFFLKHLLYHSNCLNQLTRHLQNLSKVHIEKASL